MKRLIVNADDYGRTRGVSSGIIEAHQNGIVTSTSVMMNMSSVLEDLNAIKEECTSLGVGVHLILTKGAPILPVREVPSLISDREQFYKIHESPIIFESLDYYQVYSEWKAQIKKFLSTGFDIDHLDSHHHVSFLHEKAFEVFLDLSEEYKVPIRHPFQESSNDYVSEDKELGITQIIERRSPLCPDSLISSFYDEGATLDNLLSIIKNLPEGSHELMCHPGHADQDLLEGSIYNSARERELEILTSEEVWNSIKSNNIELITFSTLKS